MKADFPAARNEAHSAQQVAAAVLLAVRAALQRPHGPVSLHEPEFRGNEWAYLKECLDTGWVSSAGKFVERFEARLAEFTGARHAIATVNGTAALHVCLRLVGVRPGDEVLVPSLTFIATANAVSYAGATPHFVDSDARFLGMDAARLDSYLREIAVVRGGSCTNRRTGAVIRACMPVHIFGHPVDLTALLDVCERWSITLVEDAAESLGSYYKGRHTGTVGRVGAMSFNGNKIVTTGGGGAIFTNDPELGRLAKHLTTTARVPHRWSFIHDQIGYNYRMPNINAALGCAQLEQLPDFLRRKRLLLERYQAAFSAVPGVQLVIEPEDAISNYWLIALLLETADVDIRDLVLSTLNDAGLMARPAWTPMHRLPMYADCPQMTLPCAEALADRIINLPSSAALADRP
jgi:perosamine synthetase